MAAVMIWARVVAAMVVGTVVGTAISLVGAFALRAIGVGGTDPWLVAACVGSATGVLCGVRVQLATGTASWLLPRRDGARQ